MIHKRAPAAILTLAALFAAAPALAHPHIFIDARAELVFDGDGRIVSVRHIWQFDSAWSAYAVQGLDADGNGFLSTAELQPMAELNVTSVAEYGYFTSLTIGGVSAAFVPPTEYFLDIYGTQLVLFFTLPLDIPRAPAGVVELQVYDPEYYVAFDFDPAQPMLLVDAPAGCMARFEAAAEPDDATAAILALIPADQRALPTELASVTGDLANTITVACS
ncbi:MAG: DUF1007 family protein [Bauldia sp.]|nr:DUF1007 family protein [Bauldia sp.]